MEPSTSRLSTPSPTLFDSCYLTSSPNSPTIDSNIQLVSQQMKPAPDIPTSTKPAQKKKNSKAKKEEAGISQTDLGEFLSQISPLYSLAKYYLENKSKFAFLKNPVMIFKAAQLTDCVHKAMEFMQKAGLLPFKQEALKTIPQQQFLTLKT